MFYHYSNFFKSSFSLSLIHQDSKQDFCRFPSKIFKGFCLLTPVRHFFPSFFIYFLISCIFSCFLGRISNLWKIEVFGFFNQFFQNWSLAFCYGMLLNWSLWFNLINLLNWKILIFLGLETTRIGVFVQLSINWWNWLIWLIDLVIIFCYITCLMINWSICWDFWKWVFQIWGFWYKLYVQANFVFLKCNWTILNALEHASCFNSVHASYRFLFFILFLL